MSAAEEIVDSLVEQVVKVQLQGHQVVLVSSGAVGFGRRIAREILKTEYGSSNQV